MMARSRRRAAPPLTKRGLAFLDFILKFTAENGFAPTLAEIGAAFKLNSLGSVTDAVKRLERDGYLSRTANRHRSLLVLRHPLRQVPANEVGA